MAELQAIFVEQGVWIARSGDWSTSCRRFVMPSAELSQLTQAIGVGLDSMVWI